VRDGLADQVRLIFLFDANNGETIVAAILRGTTVDAFSRHHAALQFFKPVQLNVNAAHTRGVFCFAPA